MKRVFICSPYAGNIDHNTKVAQAMCRQAIIDGHAPFAPHLHYPGIVDDSVSEERESGIQSGLFFMEVCDEVWAFIGYGISSGMAIELAHAKNLEKPIKEFSGIRGDYGGLGDELPEAPDCVPGEFIFTIGPSGGHPAVTSLWREKIDILSRHILESVGANPQINFWPYRHGQMPYFAFDVIGEKGSESLTITIDDFPHIPTPGDGDVEPGVVDAVDAYYLTSALFEALGVSSRLIWA